MAETPSQSPPPSRSVSETETVTEEAPQEYWCYHCDKRVSVETVANLPDIVCHDCKNGFVESIPRSDPPSQPSDQASDPYGSPFHQVLRLIAQAARDEDAPPPLPQNHPTSEDYVDAAGYEALLQTLAESDGSGRRGAPPASKAAVSELPAVDEAVVCAICKDEFDELLPKYLSFFKGLIDSDTLQLNVSREMLQAHSSLKTIKKKLIRKALDMIRKLAEEDPDESNDKAKKDVEKSDDDDEKRGQYTRFWNEFGKSIKLGIIEDAANRNRLAKLLRFESTKSDGKLTSLDQYISRMKSGQKDIFYLTGTSKEQLDNSPFLERLKKGYEVIFFTDPVDGYLMQYLMDYEDKKFQNVSKEGLKLGKDSKDKELKESYKELTKWWKGALASDNVDDVKISNRLADTPCVVVTSKFGWSANMEKIMQSQTLSDSAKQAYMRGKRVLEINPRHPIIKELRERVVKNPEDESVKHTAQLIYQTALMESGFVLPDPKDFASRIYSSVKSSLNINPDATVEEEDDTEDPAEAETPANEGTPEAEAANADSLKDEL